MLFININICILLLLVKAMRYNMYLNFCSHNFYIYFFNYMDISIAIIMYHQRLFLLFTRKQHCLQINKHDQSGGVLKIYTLTKFCNLIWFCFQNIYEC